MQFKVEETSNNSIKNDSKIPANLQYLLQKEYEASYICGKFGKMITQHRKVERCNLYIHYIEIWEPSRILFTTPKQVITAYHSYSENANFLLDNKSRKLTAYVGRPFVTNIPGLPTQHYISFDKPCYHIAWQITGAETLTLQFANLKWINDFNKKYAPKFDLNQAKNFKLKVPLETGDASYMEIRQTQIF